MERNDQVKELTLCRHIPSSQPYVPADYIIVKESFPDNVRWDEAFDSLSKELESMVASWPRGLGNGKMGEKESSRIDAKQLESLPWKPYREGRFEAWIFSNTKGAEELVDRLRKEKVVKVDGVTYRLSGPEQTPEMFVRRSKDSETKQAADSRGSQRTR